MKAIARLVLVGICAVGCGVAGRATFRAARGPGEALMPPLVSLVDVLTARERRGYPAEWQVRSDRVRKGAWASPTYGDTWVELVGHEFRGHVGTLRLHFDNGRLEDTRFYPKDQSAVVATLEQQLGVRFVRKRGWNHSVVELSENVHLVEGEDGWGRYVSWIDQRLLHESDEWWSTFANGQQSWR